VSSSSSEKSGGWSVDAASYSSEASTAELSPAVVGENEVHLCFGSGKAFRSVQITDSSTTMFSDMEGRNTHTHTSSNNKNDAYMREESDLFFFLF